MRGAIAAMLLVCGAIGAAAEPWSVVGQNAYGCKSEKDLAQLRLMSAIKAAFEIALADKIEGGNCVKLEPGEPASKLKGGGQRGRDLFQVKRADGSEYLVDAHFVQKTL